MLFRTLVFSTLFFLSVSVADAHVPVLVPTQTQSSVIVVEDPDLSQAFYGELNDLSHTYEIQSLVPFTLTLQVLVPDTESSSNNISGIVVKLPETQGRVTEIAPLTATDAEWESFYEPFGGDSYRKGPKVEKELEAGTYHIGIHTPDNKEKYVLVVGTREELSIGYFETVRRLLGVKVFFGKSPVQVVESPFVYIPLLIVVCAGLAFWYVRRKKAVQGTSPERAEVIH